MIARATDFGDFRGNALLELQEIRIPTGEKRVEDLLEMKEIRIPTGRKEGLICMLYIGIKD